MGIRPIVHASCKARTTVGSVGAYTIMHDSCSCIKRTTIRMKSIVANDLYINSLGFNKHMSVLSHKSLTMTILTLYSGPTAARLKQSRKGTYTK